MDDGTKELLKYGATFIALIALFYGGTFILRHTLGTENPMMVVISQSMVPTLGVGDFIFIEAVDDFDHVVAAPAPVGDILVFLRPGFEDEYIVHRAINGVETDDGWVYTTKGDNNPFPDGVPVREGRVIGRVINRLPIVGYFSLFIKTMKGFLLVAAFMATAFFYEYLLPKKDEVDKGKLNVLALGPYLVALVILVILYFSPVNVLAMEYVVIVAWYLGCFILPLSAHDDDMGLMIWLYHLVLVMVPIACDVVWWTRGITPSMWWSFQGSIVPVSWLLIEETPIFNTAFIMILVILLPGCALFLFNMYAKRKGWEPLYSLSKKFRGIE
ncbi:MAG: signal peptidase I [Candidatus Bathyarchaeota archaeon]